MLWLLPKFITKTKRPKERNTKNNVRDETERKIRSEWVIFGVGVALDVDYNWYGLMRFFSAAFCMYVCIWLLEVYTLSSDNGNDIDNDNNDGSHNDDDETREKSSV